MTKTICTPAPQLKKGDIVRQHGGTFEVLEDARPSRGHLPVDRIGPTCCAVAQAKCLTGAVLGYFWPGSEWTFQGNQISGFAVESTFAK